MILSAFRVQALQMPTKVLNTNREPGTMWYHSIRTKEIEKKLQGGELGQAPAARVKRSPQYRVYK